MHSSQDLLTRFKTMKPETFNNLSQTQSQQLLALFHQQLHNKNQQKYHKSKKIRRFKSMASYKKFVKKNMPIIIVNSMSRFNNPQQEPLTRLVVNGGKLSLKKSGEHNHKKESKWGCQIEFKKNYDNLLGGANVDELSCPICLQLMISPALTVCGHAFCYQCLDESLLFSSSCPNCRENIKGYQILFCGALDELIKGIAHHSSEHQQTYQQRFKRFREWKNSREVQLQSLVKGIDLDVRDTESIWCTGTVMQIYHGNGFMNKPISVLIHYHRWNKLYNQIIEVPSARLAPLRFFTLRHDIPRYNLSEEEDNLRGTVVTGRIFRQNLIQIMDSSSEEEENDISESEQDESEVAEEVDEDEQGSEGEFYIQGEYQPMQEEFPSQVNHRSSLHNGSVQMDNSNFIQLLPYSENEREPNSVSEVNNSAAVREEDRAEEQSSNSEWEDYREVKSAPPEF